MRADFNRNRNHSSQKQHNSLGKKTMVTLPYDFIPFAQDAINDYHMPYEWESLPSHNETVSSGRLSGSIDYCIYPKGDLALEFKEVKTGLKEQGEYTEITKFMSGSQIRGKIRSNVELLSGSYPVFIDRTEMLYRNLTGNRYKTKLKDSVSIDVSKEDGIESIVRVGYLEYRNGEYVITPAKTFGTKNFLAIKEFDLVEKNMFDRVSSFYEWNIEAKQQFRDSTKKIDDLRKQIKEYSAVLKQTYPEDWGDKLSKVFQKKQFNFNSAYIQKNKDSTEKVKLSDKNYDYTTICAYLDQLAEKLKRDLKQTVNGLPVSKESKFDKLVDLSVDRWKLKAGLYFYYLKKMKKNNKYKPYEKAVFFESNGNEHIKHISWSSDHKSTTSKGMLFSSTNASSKRTHYLVNEPVETDDVIMVEQHTINAYKKQFDKIRFNTKDQELERELKSFYNLFPEDDSKQEKKIVFYLKVIDKVTEGYSLYLGRTPYFRIGYDHQLKNLLKNNIDNNKLDYARALFGFVPDELDDLGQHENGRIAYKSRLRFSSVQLYGEKPEIEKKTFLLPSPSATAEGMYIHAERGKSGKATYEQANETSPIMNGHKFYHILKETQLYDSKADTKKVETCKLVYKFDSSKSFYFEGKIYFSNLTVQELGVLILALDISKLTKSKYFEEVNKTVKMLDGDLYEQIGGAKPYGYGKVQIGIKQLSLEKQGSDFESLIVSPTVDEHDFTQYVDAFLHDFADVKLYFKKLLTPYIQSKQKISVQTNGSKKVLLDGAEHLTWSDMGGNRKVGYDRESYLKSRFLQ